MFSRIMGGHSRITRPFVCLLARHDAIFGIRNSQQALYTNVNKSAIMKLKLKTSFCLMILCISISTGQQEDNEELTTLYKADQSDRKAVKRDWKQISFRDSIRRKKVTSLLESNQIKTANDYENAAMIFQHGKDSLDYKMAVKMMRKAIELDPKKNKWLLAATIDRELMSRKKPQIYGTQFVRKGKDDPWELYKMDTTKISDIERKAHRVETLAELKEKVKLLNKKHIATAYDEKAAIDEFIGFLRKEKNGKEESNYNLTEASINNYGYELMKQDKYNHALALFKLNVEFYPQAANTYDSLGECLLKLGEIKEGLRFYQKSLSLNPKNKNAEKILIEYQKKGIQN